MAILPAGIAILASLVCRVEHKNGNWNALMSRPIPSAQVVVGKVAAVVVLAAAMQLVLVVTVITLGEFAFGLPGMLACPIPLRQRPRHGGLRARGGSAICAVDVPALLRRARRNRSLVFTGASTMALLLDVQAVLVLPYAMLTHATQIGTTLISGEGTSFNASALTVESALFVVLIASAVSAVIIAVTAMLLNRSDTRA